MEPEELLSELDAMNDRLRNKTEEYKAQIRLEALAILGGKQWQNADSVRENSTRENSTRVRWTHGLWESLMGFLQDETLHTIAEAIVVPVCLTAAAVASIIFKADGSNYMALQATFDCTYPTSPVTPVLKDVLLKQVVEVLSRMLGYEGPEAVYVRNFAARSMERLCRGQSAAFRNTIGARPGVLRGLLNSMDCEDNVEVRMFALETLTTLASGMIPCV